MPILLSQKFLIKHIHVTIVMFMDMSSSMEEGWKIKPDSPRLPVLPTFLGRAGQGFRLIPSNMLTLFFCKILQSCAIIFVIFRLKMYSTLGV